MRIPSRSIHSNRTTKQKALIASNVASRSNTPSDWVLSTCPDSAILVRLTSCCLPHFHTACTQGSDFRVEWFVIPRPHRSSGIQGFSSAGHGRPDEEISGCRDSEFGRALVITERGFFTRLLLDHFSSRFCPLSRRSIKGTVSSAHLRFSTFTSSISENRYQYRRLTAHLSAFLLSFQKTTRTH